MKHGVKHISNAFLTFFVSLAIGVLLLPLLRQKPESFHTYFNELSTMQRCAFIFALCLGYNYLLFKLFSPRISHLKYVFKNFPTWLAWFTGIIFVGVIDTFWGLNPQKCEYQSNILEWLFYGVGSFLCVSLLYNNNFFSFLHLLGFGNDKQESKSEPTSVRSFKNAQWEDIETWLNSDAVAKVDFIDNNHIPKRIIHFLKQTDTRSVGLIGPFGAGKSTIVNWIKECLESGSNNENSKLNSDSDFLVCEFSCWGFENSNSAIHEMLKKAIRRLQDETDTFRIQSLPDEYLISISGGGKWKWLYSISKILLPNKTAHEQFTTLNDILAAINAKLLFVVEDLDRNNSSSFDIQEVVAFLQQLKDYNNLKFVLTGGIKASRTIDYTKLCDHMDILQSTDRYQVIDLIQRVFQNCCDTEQYMHPPYGDLYFEFKDNPFFDTYNLSHNEFSLAHAVATLLDTPRSLRHSFKHTLNAWKELCGEIDFNHLVAVNVLRYGAPECFLFMLRRWDFLNFDPYKSRFSLSNNAANSKEKKRIENVKKSILQDWEDTISEVEWNTKAAYIVMQSILPDTSSWLDKESPTNGIGKTIQGINNKTHWFRAINEYIRVCEIRDQKIISDFYNWKEQPSQNPEMIKCLTSSDMYIERWKDWKNALFKDEDFNIPLASQKLLDAIREKQGAESNYHSTGFQLCENIMRDVDAGPKKNLDWLEARISDALKSSLRLAFDLHNHFCIRSSSHINDSDKQNVSDYIFNEIIKTLTNKEDLSTRLSPCLFDTLSLLVYGSSNKQRDPENELEKWKPLSLIIFGSLQEHNLAVALNCLPLFATNDVEQNSTHLSSHLINHFFDKDGPEVLRILSQMKNEMTTFLENFDNTYLSIDDIKGIRRILRSLT